MVSDNVASRRAFQSMHPRSRSDLASDLPPWRIVPAAPAAGLLTLHRAAEDRFGVDRAHLAAINFVETSMGRIRGTSVAGAQGPMQFLPSTWDIYGRGDIDSTRDSILAAGRYLEAEGFNRPGGRAAALYRYNNSQAYVRGVTQVAQLMQRRPCASYGCYHWEVYYWLAELGLDRTTDEPGSRGVVIRRWWTVIDPCTARRHTTFSQSR